MANKLTVQTAIDVFLLDCSAKNLKKTSYTFYKQQLGYFRDYLKDHDCCFLLDITSQQIKNYFIFLQQKNLTPNSVHAAARSIRAFFNYCIEDTLITVNPFKPVSMPKVNEYVLPAFTKEEITKMLEACENFRDKCLILSLLDSMCRANELLAWKVRDINLLTGVVQISVSKNRKTRIVFLGFKTRKELTKLIALQDLQPDDYIFRALDDNKPLGYSGLAITLRKIGKRAGVAQVNPHKFRRTGCIFALRNGMSVPILQKILGHTDPNTIKRYLPLVDKDLVENFDKFGAVDHL